MSIIERYANQRGIPLESLSDLSGVSAKALLAPTVSNLAGGQVKELSSVLGIDPSSLYLDEPAHLRSLPVDFRTHRNDDFMLTKSALSSIYQAYSLSEYVRIVSNKITSVSSPNKIIGSHSLGSNSIFDAINDIVKFDFSDFSNINDPYLIFNVIRYNIDQSGIYVVSERVNDPTLKGFCITDEHFGMIFVNSAHQSSRARIFTLLHELVHLLVAQPGISSPLLGRKPIERQINAIVARYLIPDDKMVELWDRFPNQDAKAFVDHVFRALPFSRFFIAIRVSEVISGQKSFADRWLKSVGLQNRTDGDLRGSDFYKELNLTDSAGEDESDNTFTPRSTSASYQVSRLGFGLLSLAEIATNSRISNKFDLLYFLRIPPKNFEKVLSSLHRKISEVRKIASIR
jgi:Zn-dependent peptidase ImmA (M78 family)